MKIKSLPFLVLSLAFLTVNCAQTGAESSSSSPAGSPTQNTPSQESPSSTPVPIQAQRASNPLTPGAYCFIHENKTFKGTVEINIKNNGVVDGTTSGIVSEEDGSFLWLVNQTLTGSINGNTLALKVMSEVEGSRQESQESWRINTQQLTTEQPNNIYQRLDCAVANGREYQPTNSPFRIKFERGASSASIANTVFPDVKQIYLVEAQKGQEMKLQITPNRELSFDVFAPSGEAIEEKLTDITFTLPESGDYQIIIHPVEQVAQYQLEVGIK